MNQSSVTLTGVGLGPGDPELLTLKGLKAMQDADVIFTAVSRQSSTSVSLRIVRSLPDLSADIVELVFAMRNTEERAAMIEKNADIIISSLNAGKNCVFATIGDPLTYSTFGYIMKVIREKAPHIKINVVPGVNSWSVLAAETATILVEDMEPLTIIPSYKDGKTEIPDIMGTKVFLKTYRTKNDLIDQLAGEGRELLYGANLGLDSEFISDSPSEIRERDDEYLSMLVVKDEKE